MIDPFSLERKKAWKEIWIYFLFKWDKIVYIWQSADIIARTNMHYTNEIDFDSFSFINCDRKELLRLESKYIREYNPEHNKVCIEIKEYKEIPDVIIASRFKIFIKRVKKFSWKIHVKNHYSGLHWKIDFKYYLRMFLKDNKIKLTDAEILFLLWWNRF